jgi:sugar (pentulose or hexulose) kinase
LLAKSGIRPEDILAVALDSATHTFLLCDEEYAPLGNAIHWTDTRSRKEADDLRERFGETIFQKAFHKILVGRQTKKLFPNFYPKRKVFAFTHKKSGNAHSKLLAYPSFACIQTNAKRQGQFE